MPPRTAAIALLLLTACSAAPDGPKKPVGEPALDAKQEAQRKAESDKSRREFARVRLQAAQAMESYTRVLAMSDTVRAELDREKLDRLLRQLVNGERNLSGEVTDPNKPRFLADAADSSDPINQGIALAALGFAEGSDVMPVILQGAQLKDPQLVDRAVLGLAIKKDPRTPPGVVVAVMEDKKHPEDGRVQASWALCVLQESSTHTEEILATWRRVLASADDWHPAILGNAIRGLGLARKPDDAALVARFAQHPTPKVRINTAVALGRMNAQEQWTVLVEMIGPAETSPNVRLAASKALKALAGGANHGYDQNLWRREFDRGGQKPAQPASPKSEPAKPEPAKR